MNWQKLIAYTLGGIALIVCGWLLHSTFIPKPTTTVETKIVTDTITTVKKIYFTKTDTITKVISNGITTYADSIHGQQQEVDYKIKHSIRLDKETVSDWQVNLEPRLKTIVQYVTKDSVRTIVEAKYISLRFFLNPYFWSTIISVVFTALAIIF